MPQVVVSKWSFASLLPGYSKAMVIDVFFFCPQLQVFIAEHETNTFVKTTSFLVLRNQCPQVPFPSCKGSFLSKCHFCLWTNLGSTKLLCLFFLAGMLQASEREIFLALCGKVKKKFVDSPSASGNENTALLYVPSSVQCYSYQDIQWKHFWHHKFKIMKSWVPTAHCLLPFRPCLARKWSSVRRQAFSRNSTRFLNASQEKNPWLTYHKILVV